MFLQLVRRQLQLTLWKLILHLRKKTGLFSKSSSLFYFGKKKWHRNIFPWSYSDLFFNLASTARLVWTYPHQDFVWTMLCIFQYRHSTPVSAHTSSKILVLNWNKQSHTAKCSNTNRYWSVTTITLHQYVLQWYVIISSHIAVHISVHCMGVELDDL